MTVNSISALGLSQNVFSSGYSPQQPALQQLQESLASGNLSSALAAFQTLQTVLQNSATASGSTEAVMTVNSISALGLSQNVFSSGYSPQQPALQQLQESLASGNLSGALAAFQTLQTVLQNSATASGSILSANSQLAADLKNLGSALSDGNLSTARSAFATVLGDLKNSASAAQINESSAASQSVELVKELLSPLNSGGAGSSASEVGNSLLQSLYGPNGLNVLG